MHLREPLIPVRVQQLVLAENPGVPERMVASDALGLLRQDLSGRHLELLRSLLDLLYVPSDVMRWKQVATTFNELINTAPLWLDKCGSREQDDQPEEQPPHYMYKRNVHLNNNHHQPDILRDDTSISLLLQQQNRRFLRGEPSDRRSLTSIAMVPLVFLAHGRLHPMLRIFS
ncbi:hypothetical protein C0J52_11588 [Blattella germanica]|nr:hypothetical protein C0J52_11588 [Blattella germanica]